MPSHYEEEKKVERSRLPGLRPGEKLTTAGPGIEAIKSAVSETGKTLFGGIAPETRGGYRGYETGGRAGTGFMESGIPIPTDQAGVMQPMPVRPAVGRTVAPIMTLPDGTGGAGAVGTGGAMPTSPVDLTPRLGEIEAGVEGGIPSAFDTKKAHDLGMARYPEGQAYIPYEQPRLSAGQQSVYGDVLDKFLPSTKPGLLGGDGDLPEKIPYGPGNFRDYAGKPTSIYGDPVEQPEGYDPRLADIMSRATQPTQQGAIPSGISGPGSSGNAMVDLFRWVSHNKRVQQQNKIMAEQKKLGLESERYAGEQEFKERKLASEEKGREATLDLSRRKAIATEAKKAEKRDPSIKEARAFALKTNPDFAYLPKEEQDTIILREIKKTRQLHGQEKPSGRQKPTVDGWLKAAKEQGSKLSEEQLKAEFKKKYPGV